MSNKPNLNKDKPFDSSNLNRAYEMRRDNDIIKVPKITFEDIDFAVMYYLQNVISPQIEENGYIVDVPLIYANSETWNQIRAEGFLRDKENKIKTPLMTIQRATTYERPDVKKLEVNDGSESRYTIKKVPKRDLESRFDKLSSTTNTSKGDEFYISLLPRLYKVVYNLRIWTEYEADMNKVVESILPKSGHSWGDELKFPAFVGDFEFDTVNASSEERAVISNTQITVDGYLVNEFDIRKSNVQKAISIKRVVFNGERDGGIDISLDGPKMPYVHVRNPNY